MEKPDYTIINEGAGFALYRKLFPGEEIWYMDELYRLKKDHEGIWLKLNNDIDKEVLKKELINIEKGLILYTKQY